MSLKIIETYFNKSIQRINSLFCRAEVTLTDDSRKFQSAQLKINDDDILDDVERFQNYGFTSNPLSGSEALAIFKGGKRSHGFIIAIDDRRFRFKNLKNGEVAIYTDEGDFIHLKRDNKIEVSTKDLTVNASEKVTINAPNVKVNATKVEVVTQQLIASSETASITSPTIQITASTGVTVNSPALVVSGTVACSGLSAGPTPPSPGKVIADNVEATGNVKDSVGTMSQMRTTYNTHKHSVGSDQTTIPSGTM